MTARHPSDPNNPYPDPGRTWTWWGDNENEGVPDDDQILDMAIAAGPGRADEVHDALLGMIGLIQAITSRADIPEDIRKGILSSPRYIDARTIAKAYL